MTNSTTNDLARLLLFGKEGEAVREARLFWQPFHRDTPLCSCSSSGPAQRISADIGIKF